MKTKLFQTGMLLSCAKNTAPCERFIFAWAEIPPEDAPNERLGGWPNKEALGETEDNPETAEGRNIIRGQAIIFLKKYPFEDGENGSKHLHDCIRDSRLAELELTADGEKDTSRAETLEQNKIDTAKTLKTALDAFRKQVTEADADDNAKLVWKEPSQLNENFLNLGEGRNQLRHNAQQWLDQNPSADPTIRASVQEALTNSTKLESGQYKVENPAETSLPDPEEAANALKRALDAARGGKPAPAPVSPKSEPASKPAEKKEASTDLQKSLDALSREGFVMDVPPKDFEQSAYAKYGEKRVMIMSHKDETYSYEYVSLPDGRSEMISGANVTVDAMKQALDALPVDKLKVLKEDLRHVPNHTVVLDDADLGETAAPYDNEEIFDANTHKVDIKGATYQKNDGSLTKPFDVSLFVTLDKSSGLYRGLSAAGDPMAPQNNALEFVELAIKNHYQENRDDIDKP